MGIMSIVKNVIEHFRKAGKTENEISDMIEQAADRATVNKGVTEKKEYKRPEIKVETSAEQFVEAVMQTGVTAEQVKTAIMKMCDSQRCTNRQNTNNWRKSRKRGKSMKEEKEQTVIDKTLLYLENYREMERYIKEAVSETSQVPDIGKYNISAERAFLQSVRECRAETVILFEHLKQALASLKEDAEAAGERYKYDALEAVYIKGKTYEDIVRETGCGRNSPKKWCKVMIQRLSIKLFGAKAIENDKNGVKTG